MGQRVFIVGLDGATFDLILPWIKNGELPFLRETMMNGAYGELKSTIPTLSPTAWSSFMTGANPGKHGILGFFTRDKDNCKLKVANATHRKLKEFWMLLGENGKSVGVLNVPLTYPSKKVNGFMITGMMTPPGAEKFAYPSCIKERVKEIIGKDTIDPLFTYLEGDETFIKKLFDSTEKLAKLCYSLVKEYNPDFFTVVFNGTDYIQHKFWRFLDDNHPHYKTEKASKIRKIVLAYYQLLDGIIAEIYSLAGDDATLIIMSDHGAGPLQKYFHVNSWLLHNGFLYLKENIKTKFKEYLYKARLSPEKIYNSLLKLRVGDLGFKGYRADSKLRFALEKLFLSLSDIDWARTKAFSIGSGLIYINLKGREPYGTVNPGREYEELIEELIYRLEKIKDVESGQYVIEKVYRKEEIYSGPFLDDFPDLIILTNNSYATFEECEFGAYNYLTSSEAVSGTHKLNGIFLMKGPKIKRGIKLNGVRIVDIAPTVLYLFDLPVPSYMDGQPLYKALKGHHVAKKPAKTEKTSLKDVEDRESPYTREEEEQIMQRLRRLGYIS